jgi:hypothetical protein
MTRKGHAPRDAWGRFNKGHSGNPLGRPTKWRRGEIVRAYRELGDSERFAKWLIRRSRHSSQAAMFVLGLWAPHPKYGLRPPSRRFWR